jgi:hypothetical protein
VLAQDVFTLRQVTMRMMTISRKRPPSVVFQRTALE